MTAIDEQTLRRWWQLARRDDWHATFIGSDIRVMLAEIERLRAALKGTEIALARDSNIDGAMRCILHGRADDAEGAAMSLLAALDMLAGIHTVDDSRTGFSVRLGAKPEFSSSYPQYVQAWSVVREFAGRPFTPEHYPGRSIVASAVEQKLNEDNGQTRD